MSMKTWTWLDIRLWCSNVIKKEASEKRIAAWGDADFMPVNWNPFYDTSYDINQITSMHNINVTLQLVSAQNNAHAREVTCAHERECVLPLWCAFNNAAETRVRTEFTIDFTSYKVLIILLFMKFQ